MAIHPDHWEVAALVSLTQENIPPDVLELLTHGNPDRGVRPHALKRAIDAAMAGSDEAVVQDALVAEAAIDIAIDNRTVIREALEALDDNDETGARLILKTALEK